MKEEPSPSATPSPTQSAKFETTHHDHLLSFLGSEKLLTACLIMAAVSVAIFLPVIFRGLPNGHDAGVHYRWAVQFKEALQESGVFYPRWLASANHQQGSPVMLYYPPLPFFISATLSLLTKDMLQALAFSCWLAIFLSGLAMYVFCRSHFSPGLSLFAALFYLATPYHLFDFYHRMALAELWSFVWIPLIFDALYRITVKPGGPATLYLATGYALLLFTHLPVAFALTFVAVIYVLLHTRKLNALMGVVAGLVLGFGVSATFTIPVWFERDYVKFQRLLGIKYDNNFLFETFSKSPLLQLTEPGGVDTLKLADWTALSLVLIFLFALVLLFFNRATKNLSAETIKSLRVILAVSLLALLMTTRISSPLWKLIPQFAYLQFPFRWLTLVSAGAAFLAGGALSLLLDHTKRRPLLVTACLTLAVTLAVSATVIAKTSYDRETILKSLDTVEVKEYFPLWWDQPKRLEKQNFDEEIPAISVASGTAEVKAKDDAGVNQVYEVKATSDATLNFRALYFPGWVAYVDEQKTAVEANDKGSIQLAVQAGEHSITLKFEDTAPRRVGKIISSLGLLAGLLIFAFGKRWRRTKRLS